MTQSAPNQPHGTDSNDEPVVVQPGEEQPVVVEPNENPQNPGGTNAPEDDE